MNRKEILEMQRRIDDGIRLAHKRLLERASVTHQPLVVNRDGRIVDFLPESPSSAVLKTSGNPLARRDNK